MTESSFSRKTRKFNSILAGEASAKFSLLLNDIGVFDCRISQLPNAHLVIDYFRWRNEDAFRNSLNAHCYWSLRNNEKSAKQATSTISGLSVGEKNELLFQNGINFNDIPDWQKRGIGFYWESFEKEGVNPISGVIINSIRKRIKIDFNLPKKMSIIILSKTF